MQALIPKATLLQGLRPNLNEGDHCVFPLGSGWGKIVGKSLLRGKYISLKAVGGIFQGGEPKFLIF